MNTCRVEDHSAGLPADDVTGGHVPAVDAERVVHVAGALSYQTHTEGGGAQEPVPGAGDRQTSHTDR